MREAYSLVWSVLVLLFRSRVSLEAEILILHHQLNIQRRHVPKRVAFSAMDRLIFIGLYEACGWEPPVPRGVEWAGNIVCRPILGGLHHQYGRM